MERWYLLIGNLLLYIFIKKDLKMEIRKNGSQFGWMLPTMHASETISTTKSYNNWIKAYKGKQIKALWNRYAECIPFVKIDSDDWPDYNSDGSLDLGTGKIWHNVLFYYKNPAFGALLDGKVKDIYCIYDTAQMDKFDGIIGSYLLVSTESGDAFVDSRTVSIF